MKEKIIKFLKKFNIFDIFIMSGGMAIAQIVTILAQPIATRIYTPEQFGVFTLVLQFATMFSACACLQYEITIITAPDEKEANQTTALCFYILLFTTLVFLISAFVYNLFASGNSQFNGALLYISALFFFLIGFQSIITTYNKRCGEYKIISSISVYRSLLHTSLKLLLGWIKTGSFGLIFSAVFSYTGGLKKQAGSIIKNRKEIFSTKFKDLKRLIKKNIAQPLFHMPGMFISSYSYTVIPIYLTSLYGNLTDVGFYSQTTAILDLPLVVIGNNISTVFLTNATRERNETGSYRHSLRKAVLLLAAVAIPSFLAIYFFAPWAFSFFFGEQWIRSGYFAKIMCPWYFIRFTATSIDCTLIIEKKQNVALILRSFMLVLSVAIYFVCRNFALPVEQFLNITSISFALFYLVIIGLVYKYALRSKKTA